jgi:hypothetical protein
MRSDASAGTRRGAENLRHVLQAIEGLLISGYADGGDVPDKQLQLVPGAVTDVQETRTLPYFVNLAGRKSV